MEVNEIFGSNTTLSGKFDFFLNFVVHLNDQKRKQDDSYYYCFHKKKKGEKKNFGRFIDFLAHLSRRLQGSL